MENSNRTVVITGGTSGLGYQSAKALAEDGWQVIVTSRSKNQGEKAAHLLNSRLDVERVEGFELDLASQDSIRKFAEEIKVSNYSLNAIVCNAGITLSGPTQYTQEGIEKTFGVNHLGHFLLVNLLFNVLNTPARIVFVSSGTHIPDHKLARRTGTPVPVYTTARDLAYPSNEKGGMAGQSLRYTTSKLCNVLCANELARRIADRGLSSPDAPIDVFSIDPGLMPGTGLSREYLKVLTNIMAFVFNGIRPFVDGIRTPEESARDIARLINDPLLSGKSGTYYDGAKEVSASPVAYDLEKAKELWESSVELVGLTAEQSPLIKPPI